MGSGGIERDCADMLTIRDLSISHATTPLFSGLSLRVEPGEVVTVSGASMLSIPFAA